MNAITDTAARRAANALITIGAIAAVSYVLLDPERRRLAWRAGKAALLTSLPTYLLQEAGRAWAEAGPELPRIMTPPGPATLASEGAAARLGFWGVR